MKKQSKRLMKQLWKNTITWSEPIHRPIKIIISIGSVILLLIALRWMGFKGILGLIIGMAIMAILILSKNQFMLGFIKYIESEVYIDEINKKEK